MKKLIFVLFLICFVANYGCNSRRVSGAVSLDELVKVDARPVTLDTILITDEFLFAKRMYVYKDNYLVVENYPNNKTVPFIEIYDIPNQQRLKGFIHNGNSPDEMVMIDTHLTGNILLIRDFAKEQYAAINLDVALSDDSYRPAVKKVSTNMGISQLAWLDNDHMVLENPNYFEDDNLGIHKGEERLLIVPQSTLSDKVEFTISLPITSGVSQGQIVANSSKDRIMYALSNFSVIEVYDGSLKKLKTINGPDVLPRSFKMREGSPQLVFNGGIPMSYTSFCCNEDYLWLSYVGNFFEGDTLNRLLHKTPSYIFKFDWEGNFISSLSVGTYVSPISVGSDGETLYAMAYDQEDLPVPVKLVMK